MKRFLFLLMVQGFASLHAAELTLSKQAWIDFSNGTSGGGMAIPLGLGAGQEGYSESTTVSGVPCRRIPAGKFLYVHCSRNAVPTTAQKIILSITYLDNTMSPFWINYTRDTAGWGNGDFQKSRTNKWVNRIIVVGDAGLNGSMGYGGDIRMGFSDEDNFIKDIAISIGSFKPDSEPVPAKLNDPESEFKGKSFAGYQLWHQAGDRPIDWKHWSYGKPPAAGRGNHNTEMFPYLAGYLGNPDVTLYATNFANLGDGNPTKLYNSTDIGVIDAQMAALGKAGFDGVAIQRNVPVGRDLKNTATDDYYVSIKNACEKNKRLFYVMYCMPDQNNTSVVPGDLVDGVKRDWVYQMEKIYALTSSPAYATVNGKPVVELWGIGYNTIQVDKQQATDLANFFKSRGCFVIAGVPQGWRANTDSRPDFKDVYLSYDMISPWVVGVFNSIESANSYRDNYLIPDKAYCDQSGIGLFPAIFPGGAWSQHVTGYPNDTPRRGGAFLWAQALNIKSVGLNTLYFSMLDEFEESTNIINTAVDYFDIPTDQYFGTLSMDGIWVSPDYYLRLAAAAAKMVSGRFPKTLEIPIPYSEGPLYYRNSFEKRTANCLINAAPLDTLMPIDAGFYNPQVQVSAGVTAPVVQMEEALYTKSGKYAVKVSGSPVSAAASMHYYKFAETKIGVKDKMQISFWKYTVNDLGKYVSVDLMFKSGKNLRDLAGFVDNNGNAMNPATGRGTIGGWEQVTCEFGKGALVGDTVVGIVIGYDHPAAAGSYAAYIDDVLIQDGVDAPASTRIQGRTSDRVVAWFRNGELIFPTEFAGARVTVYDASGHIVFLKNPGRESAGRRLGKGRYLIMIEKDGKSLLSRATAD